MFGGTAFHGVHSVIYEFMPKKIDRASAKAESVREGQICGRLFPSEVVGSCVELRGIRSPLLRLVPRLGGATNLRRVTCGLIYTLL